MASLLPLTAPPGGGGGGGVQEDTDTGGEKFGARGGAALPDGAVLEGTG